MLPASGRMAIPGLNTLLVFGICFRVDCNDSVSVVALIRVVLDCHQLFH